MTMFPVAVNKYYAQLGEDAQQACHKAGACQNIQSLYHWLIEHENLVCENMTKVKYFRIVGEILDIIINSKGENKKESPVSRM